MQVNARSQLRDTLLALCRHHPLGWTINDLAEITHAPHDKVQDAVQNMVKVGELTKTNPMAPHYIPGRYVAE